jgi:N-acetylglucosaminyl-diphospho-decaprenol L-rhamnosyltransferase
MDAHLAPVPHPVPSTAPPRSAGTSRVALDAPLISVVVVNYHQWRDTAYLVRQLRAEQCLRGGAAEVIVVDNYSEPHPAVARLRRLSGVSLRRWRRNRGFARAVNEGARLSRGDWVLLLNPDVTLSPGFLDDALARAGRMADEPDVGVVGFGLRNPDGSRQLSTGPFPTLAGTLARLLLPRHRRKYSEPPPSGRVDWATGCCLLVRRQCWDDLGGLDPAFFLYYEDVDLCRRARAAGWTVRHEPKLWVVHHRPLHGRQVPPHLRLITRHALLTYATKHWPQWQRRILAGIVRTEARVRGAVARARGDVAADAVFGELSTLASELAAGRTAAAARRLIRVVRQQEGRRASSFHRYPQS